MAITLGAVDVNAYLGSRSASQKFRLRPSRYPRANFNSPPARSATVLSGSISQPAAPIEVKNLRIIRANLVDTQIVRPDPAYSLVHGAVRFPRLSLVSARTLCSKSRTEAICSAPPQSCLHFVEKM